MTYVPSIPPNEEDRPKAYGLRLLEIQEETLEKLQEKLQEEKRHADEVRVKGIKPIGGASGWKFVNGRPIAVPNSNAATAPITDKIGQMAAARQKHMRAVDEEATLSKLVHSLTRHGAQTGWEAQLLRICTKLTPDQDYDPLGILPIDKVLEKHTTMNRNKQIVSVKNRTGGGVAAGAFYSAEVQDELTISCMSTTNQKVRPFPFCEIQTFAGKKLWARYNFIHVYAIAARGGSGVAFVKLDDWAPLKPEIVVHAIDDFCCVRTKRGRAKIDFACEHGFQKEIWVKGFNEEEKGSKEEMEILPIIQKGRVQTVDDFLADRNLLEAATKIQKEVIDGDHIRFPTWGALLGFLKVKQIWRNGCRTEISMKVWDSPSIMTMMPETVDPMDVGFAPTTFVTVKEEDYNFDWIKQQGADNKINFKNERCIWTGGLRSANGLTTTRVVPPSWARAFPS